MTLTDAEIAAALAVALVERYAPDAPPAVQNEAAIRSEVTGDVRTTFDGARSLGALRHSGAMGLLSPWKVRRAGAI